MAGHLPHAVLFCRTLFPWGGTSISTLSQVALAKQAHFTCQSLAKQAHFTFEPLANQAHFTYEVFSCVPSYKKPCKEISKQTFKIVFKRDFPYKAPFEKALKREQIRKPHMNLWPNRPLLPMNLWPSRPILHSNLWPRRPILHVNLWRNKLILDLNLWPNRPILNVSLWPNRPIWHWNLWPSRPILHWNLWPNRPILSCGGGEL